mmetsp:Transcript_113/g.126  ORF Transcript_113/g.126 Transcript_113/m.126 type:complete len:175 (+) Transcript_113:1000-1524(+)
MALRSANDIINVMQVVGGMSDPMARRSMCSIAGNGGIKNYGGGGCCVELLERALNRKRGRNQRDGACAGESSHRRRVMIVRTSDEGEKDCKTSLSSSLGDHDDNDDLEQSNDDVASTPNNSDTCLKSEAKNDNAGKTSQSSISDTMEKDLCKNNGDDDKKKNDDDDDNDGFIAL